MSISGKRYAFTKDNVDKSPRKAGVYALYAGGVLIYYGRALGGTATLRARLQSHQAGQEGTSTQTATHYRREKCADPVAREQDLLKEFSLKHDGALPSCNEKIG